MQFISPVSDFLSSKALVHSAPQSNAFPPMLHIFSEQIIRDMQNHLKADDL